MIKKKIIEITERYDGDGNLLERIKREETIDDDGFPIKHIEYEWGKHDPLYNNSPYEPHCTVMAKKSTEESYNRVGDQ